MSSSKISELRETPDAKRCVVCGDPLPTLTFDQLLKGGRPRLTCGGACKYRKDRRDRTLVKMTRHRNLIAARGRQDLAAEVDGRIAALKAEPYTTVAAMSAVSPGTARRLYAEQQQRLRQSYAGRR